MVLFCYATSKIRKSKWNSLIEEILNILSLSLIKRKFKVSLVICLKRDLHFSLKKIMIFVTINIAETGFVE